MKNKEKQQKRRLSTSKALMWRMTAVVLAMWLAGMCFLTLIVTQDQYERYVEDLERSMNYLNDPGDWYTYDSETESYTRNLDYRSILRNYEQMIYCHNPELSYPFREDYVVLDWFDGWLKFWNDVVDASEDSALVVLDGSNQVMMGQDGYAYLMYLNENLWFGTEGAYIEGYTKINLNRTQCGRAVMGELREINQHSHKQLRLTGYFEGEEFVLVDAAYFDEDVEREKIRGTQWDQQNTWYGYFGAYDYAVGIEWIDLYHGDVPADRELCNIYPDYEMYVDRAGEVLINGKTWKLEKLAQEYGCNPVMRSFIGYSSVEIRDEEVHSDRYDHDTVRTEEERYTKDSLWETVVIHSGAFYDEQDNLCPYIMVFRFQPIKVAMLLLVEVYFISVVPLILLLFLIRRRIREDLSHPLKHVMKYAGHDYQALPDTVESDWQEIYDLEQGYIQIQQAIHEYKKEITQLKTALDYAHNAEENRKRMISNITHELKTPLAVIHSYAEGLKEGIAADKQDRYLEVILEEAERMDGMVLEMLDLSRLEAGKVRLSSDRFSLLELTKSVFEKLSPLVEDKSLQIEYIWPQDFEITADEGRMAQVVTNFATNAIKYSPEGGKIYIQITRYKERTSFTIGNQCEPLPEEALEKIWDSFYRTSASRTEKGTGLGLTITKAIVELHGGTCLAQNTADGVEFKFEIP